jgi:hypothetical protein
MHTDMIWQMALERQAGFRDDARRSALSHAMRRHRDAHRSSPARAIDVVRSPLSGDRGS